jgi:hypothetical protein
MVLYNLHSLSELLGMCSLWPRPYAWRFVRCIYCTVRSVCKCAIVLIAGGGGGGEGLAQKTDRFLWQQHSRSRATCMLKLCMAVREFSQCGFDLGLACVNTVCVSWLSVLLWLLGCSFQGVFLEVCTVYFHFIFLVGNMFLKGTVSLWKKFSKFVNFYHWLGTYTCMSCTLNMTIRCRSIAKS